MSDDANDVTKALAAFGAPSIRYHSFGQSAFKPNGLTQPRRPATVALPPVLPAAAVVQQEEPIAAPEPMPTARMAPIPAPVSPPRPAPILSDVQPGRSTPLFPPAPTVAPPPRPLAEWAAPIGAPAVRPTFAPTLAPLPANVVPPESAPVTIPAPPPVSPPPRPAPPLVAVAPLVSAAAAPSPTTSFRRPAQASAMSTLADVFEFLAAG